MLHRKDDRCFYVGVSNYLVGEIPEPIESIHHRSVPYVEVRDWTEGLSALLLYIEIPAGATERACQSASREVESEKEEWNEACWPFPPPMPSSYGN